MRNYKEILTESSTPLKDVNDYFKKAGYLKWDGGWTLKKGIVTGPVKVNEFGHFIRKVGFKPLPGKQAYKTMGGKTNWTFYLPKAGPYREVNITIATTDGITIHNVHVQDYVDKT